jgi:hypothetical protein
MTFGGMNAGGMRPHLLLDTPTSGAGSRNQRRLIGTRLMIEILAGLPVSRVLLVLTATQASSTNARAL